MSACFRDMQITHTGGPRMEAMPEPVELDAGEGRDACDRRRDEGYGEGYAQAITDVARGADLDEELLAKAAARARSWRGE